MSFRRFISFWIVVSFFLTTLGPLPKAHADTVLGLPAPGTMVNLSPAYEPVIIKGLTVHKDNPFLFDFIVDVGQDKMSGEPLKKEGEKLIKYFLASLAIPDKDLWVNLSPYEKNRMIPEALGQTDMGRDLLEQDYILKQITASLIYPEKDLGKTFWDKVYAKAQQMYGTTQVPVNTFNKVWIMADRAEVFERNQTAFVVDSHLKVMLEEDYLALQKHNPSVIPTSSTVIPAKAGIHSLGSQIVKAIILPELEKEVNTGKNFANLRQIFNSVILSSWYKKNLKEALLNQVYANKSKVKGIERPGVSASPSSSVIPASSTVIPAKAGIHKNGSPTTNEECPLSGRKTFGDDIDDINVIYEQYLKAYKKGVFNYIKEDINTANGETMLRKYFSGGITNLQIIPKVTNDSAMLNNLRGENLVDFTTLASTKPIAQIKSTDAAMTNLRKLYDKVPQARRVAWEEIDKAKAKPINQQINQAVEALSMMINFNEALEEKVPSKKDILASMIDTSVFHPELFNGNIQDKFGVGEDVPPTFVFDGNIFKTFLGEKKPYRIALTLGKDIVAVTTTYSDLPDYESFTSWKKPGLLSDDFDLERFLLSKGGLRVLELGKNLKITLEEKYRGMPNNKPLLKEGVELARGMGDKNAPAGVFFEGGKTIFVLNEGADPKQATKEWVTSSILAGVLGRLYYAGPDMNSGFGTGIMGVLQEQADRVHEALGLPQIPVTTSIEDDPSSFDHGKWTVTSISDFESFMAVFKDDWIRKRYNINPKVALVIQGFGDVGGGLLKYIKARYSELLKDGTIIIIAVSDENGGIHDPEGLDVEALLKVSKRNKSKLDREYYKELTGSKVNEFKTGSDVFYVQSKFPQGRNDERTVIAFPAAGPEVFKSKEDIGRLKAAGVGMVISAANNPLKEDSGLEEEFEEKGILYVGSSIVSFGGIYASTKEVLYNIYEGGRKIFGEKVKGAMDGWQAYIQDGIVNQTMSLINFEMEEFKKEILAGRMTTFDKIHKDLAGKIRRHKNDILKDPDHRFLDRIAQEVKAVINQYESVEGKPLTPDHKDAIALIIILERVAEEACVRAMYGGKDSQRDLVRSHLSVLKGMLLHPEKGTESALRIAIYELGKMAAESAKQNLLLIIHSDFNDGIKRTTAEALVNIGQEQDVPLLRDLAKETDSLSLRFVLNRTADRLKNTHDTAMTGTYYAPTAALAKVTKPWVRGGIDLNTSNGMQWKVSKDGSGVEMNVDPAMIERMKRDGINWLSPVIFKITPVTNVWFLLGLHAPAKDGSLVGV